MDEQTIRTLLANFVFLINWPFENNIYEWIKAFMTILAVQCQKFKLLVQVCEENCDKVCVYRAWFRFWRIQFLKRSVDYIYNIKQKYLLKILELIQNRSTSKSALNVFSFFLINYQHSPKIFHKVNFVYLNLLRNKDLSACKICKI